MSQRPEYRLFIDESGNADLNPDNVSQQRCLSLTGLMIHRDLVASLLDPTLARIKTDVLGVPANTPLHRKELINAAPPFQALSSPKIRRRFNVRLSALVRSLDFTALTVVIDKLAHIQRYKAWQEHPYHYCMQIFIERYTYFLNRKGAVGDVMAESRSAKQDLALKDVYRKSYEQGTKFAPATDVQRALSSKKIKLRTKAHNKAGLELADLLAHPASKRLQCLKSGAPRPSNFGQELVDILLDTKYDRKSDGTVDGYGTKWLP